MYLVYYSKLISNIILCNLHTLINETICVIAIIISIITIICNTKCLFVWRALRINIEIFMLFLLRTIVVIFLVLHLIVLHLIVFFKLYAAIRLSSRKCV